jgi:hypothetical protein
LYQKLLLLLLQNGEAQVPCHLCMRGGCAYPKTAPLPLLLLLLQNGEDQVSCYLFWQYLASLVTLPAFMALYLQLLQSGQLAGQVL